MLAKARSAIPDTLHLLNCSAGTAYLRKSLAEPDTTCFLCVALNVSENQILNIR